MKTKVVPALCLLIIAGILVGALWPFTPFPRNEVTWAPGGWGLHFGDYGTVLSSGDAIQPTSKDGQCTIEIWLTPALTYDSNTILAFARGDNPNQLRIGQESDAVYVGRDVVRNGSITERPYLRIEHVFHEGTPVLLTVTSGMEGTNVYVNGRLARTRRDFGLTAADFAGRIVVANNPVGNNTWSGVLQGIGAYGRELSEQEVLRHYQAWSGGDRTRLSNVGGDALYLFLEGQGTTIRNVGTSRQPDLYIPDHYMILYPGLLRPFWKDSLSPSNLQDMANNVLAFIPLGFLLSAWIACTRSQRYSFWYSVLIGGALSLAIELLQYFIPMRVSDSMDWMMNTAGTAVGAWLYLLDANYNLLARLPVIGKIWNNLRPRSSYHDIQTQALSLWSAPDVNSSSPLASQGRTEVARGYAVDDQNAS